MTRQYRTRRSGRSPGAVWWPPELKKRSRKEFIEHDGIWERKNVEHPESSTQRGLRVGERVPGKTYARLKIPKRRVSEQRIAQMRLRGDEASPCGQLTVYFGW